MSARILLVNPPIYDFSAYDFWLKPYGLLRAAGFLRGHAEFRLFDYMDRCSPLVPAIKRYRADEWGRGEFYSQEIAAPAAFAGIRRRYHRFGVPREAFHKFLQDEGPFDAALVHTGMTYWYPGVHEVIADVRSRCPQAKIVLGGVYATLCPQHAKGLGEDLVVEGAALEPLWRLLGVDAERTGSPQQTEAARGTRLPPWELYPRLTSGVLKLTDGCPYKCTYCSVPRMYGGFTARPLERTLAEFDLLCRLGVQNIAFYDDALLHQAERVVEPFLREVLQRGARVNFHTPNAVNARLVTGNVARLMVEAGFKVVYVGFESSAAGWQEGTGGKVSADDLARAVEHFAAAGADPRTIHAYLMLGHPRAAEQQLESSMRYANGLGIRLMLAEFSPIPGTPDGELCRTWTNLDEPLNHNKTAFAVRSLGEAEVNRLKNLCRELNGKIKDQS